MQSFEREAGLSPENERPFLSASRGLAFPCPVVVGETMVKTAALFFATALAEIIGCFLPFLWLRKDGPIWLLVPAAASLAIFVWLLTLHPAASGRVYAAYGGVYVATALLWLRFIDSVKLSAYDWIGACVALCGMAIIVSGWKS